MNNAAVIHRNFLFGCIFFLGIYLRMELLGYTVTVCLTFWGTPQLFFKVTVPYYIPRFGFPASQLMLVTQHLLLSVFFILTILADVRWYLVVLISIYLINNDIEGFPGDAVVKNLPPNAGDTREAGSIPGLGRSPSVGNGNPLQYSCLENSKDRGARHATVHRVTKSQDWAHNDVEHCIMCLLVIPLSLEKYLFRSFAYLKNLSFLSLLLSCDFLDWDCSF